MNTLKILFILLSFLLIPLKSYSQRNIQDTLIINSYQARNILKDKTELKYRRRLSIQDSLHIKELEYKIKNYQESEKGYNLLLGIKEDTNKKLKLQNKIMLYSSGLIVSGLVYWNISK